jgi:hypothetical protein
VLHYHQNQFTIQFMFPVYQNYKSHAITLPLIASCLTPYGGGLFSHSLTPAVTGVKNAWAVSSVGRLLRHPRLKLFYWCFLAPNRTRIPFAALGLPRLCFVSQQIVIGVRIRTPPLWYARTYAYLYLNICLSHRCKRQSHRLKLFQRSDEVSLTLLIVYPTSHFITRLFFSFFG